MAPDCYLLIRSSLFSGWLIALLLGRAGAEQPWPAVAGDRPTGPNVILIMSDDQGLGDFGSQGNPLIQTPHLDAMRQRAATFSNFYVCPVCSPTRAGLMTGRYPYRTGVLDTWYGRSMMRPEEVTLAERFREAGYATGIFGKWHLGDNYPMRPMDQGFEQSVIHRGGGIGQSSDPLGAEGAYTDPILFHHGQPVRERGYCTDVYYQRALEFIDRCQQQQRPFFVYLPDNCPHGPFEDVPPDWYRQYKDRDLGSDQFPVVPGGAPVGPNRQTDRTARIFAMISNLDANVGRLNEALRQRDLWDNTIVIYLTDNGPNNERYTCGYRGRKTSVYEGGIRTLFMLQWPARIQEPRSVSELAGYIDVAPTLMELCNLGAPAGPPLDGVSLAPLLSQSDPTWATRRSPLFFQVHRGNQPQRYHHFAVRDHRWKLVHPSGFGQEQFEGPLRLELYDLQADPFEQTNLADQQPQQVARLKTAYESWFDDVGGPTLGEQPQRIVVAPEHENPLVLTRQDVRRDPQARREDWPQTDRWLLTAAQATPCQVRVRLPQPSGRPWILQVGTERYTAQGQGAERIFEDVQLPAGAFDLRSWEQPAEEQARPSTAAHQVFLSYGP